MDGSFHWRRWIAAPLLAALLTLTVAGIAGARQAPALVTINDPAGAVNVTRAQLDRWLEIARRSTGARAPKPATRQLRAQVMQMLIGFAWMDGEARVQGVTVTDAETLASFEKQKRQSFPKESDYRGFLRTSGQTKDDILWRVRQDLLSTALRDRVVAPAIAAVTEASVDAYIAQNGPIEIPEQRDLRVVLTKTRARAREARSALERGASWKQVARRYSLHYPSNYDGGRLPSLAEGGLDKPLRRAVFRARKGRLVGPVKTQYGYVVFTVSRVTPASVLPAKEHRKLTREYLLSEAEQAAEDTFVTALNATWKPRTVCAPAYDWVKDCSNWDGTEVRP